MGNSGARRGVTASVLQVVGHITSEGAGVMADDRARLFGTCIHESGHAVVGYLLDAGLSHMAVRDDSTGEVFPECSVCRRCARYYELHNPAQDQYSKEIQDDLRRSAAIALAGELAESSLTDGVSATEAELVQDRYLVRSRAAAVNLWKNCGCYSRQSYEGKCPECNALIASLRVSVGRIINNSRVSDAIVALANTLADRRWLYGNEVSTFLAERGLNRGSEKDTLPAAGAATCVVPR